METNKETTEIQPVTLTKEYAMSQLIRLFSALENATEDTATAVDIITKIAEGIEADPEFSRQILTPDNIAKAYALKAKSEAGTIKLADIEQAFPQVVEKIPFWSVVKTFM